jgi:ABC-2 type transport system permease protein
MYLRISLATPPAWEIALSIVLMLVTIYAILWVTARIYRVGILMYGKRPNLPEILRWLKYS